jgi:hypothetical protein
VTKIATTVFDNQEKGLFDQRLGLMSGKPGRFRNFGGIKIGTPAAPVGRPTAVPFRFKLAATSMLPAPTRQDAASVTANAPNISAYQGGDM